MDRSAFTLVELSIVLVIIGLLTGGVLTGQSLIHAAELRSVSTQFNSYLTATQTFRDKYFALPGDMPNATAYWGIAAGSTGNDNTCYTATNSTPPTCNGNGDGQVFASTGAYEPYHFWKHLANAGLIEGAYTASQDNSTPANSPSGKITSSLWYISYTGSVSGNPAMFDGQYGNGFEFGKLVPGGDPGGALLKPEDVYNIDAKMDDGKPATGKVVVRIPNSSTFASCTDASVSTALTANYLLSSTAIACAIMFRQVF